MKVLLVKLSSLGDVIHTLPAISDACARHRDLELHWVVEETFQAIPALHPGVAKVVPIAFRRWRKSPMELRTCKEFLNSIQSLRNESYDLIVDAQSLIKSAVVSFLAKGPRLGFDRASAKEPITSLCYGRRIRVEKAQHAIERSRQLLAAALNYTYSADKPDYGLSASPEVKKPVEEIGASQYLIGFHASSRVAKEWPVESWQVLLKHVAANNLHLLLPWGSERERLQATAIADQNAAAYVLPKMDLFTLGRLIRYSKAVVGVDTGLLHFAAAMQRPIVALYPTTQPALTGPTADRRSQACIVTLKESNELQADAVWQAILQVLQ